MGAIYASAANNHMGLGYADNQTQANAEIALMTGAGVHPATIAKWTGASYTSVNLPVGVNPELYQFVGGAWGLLSLVTTGALGLVNMRQAFRDVHGFLNALSEGLEGTEARLWRSDVLAKAHDIIAGLHRGNNAVGRRQAGASGLSMAQRIQYCRLMFLGTSDLSSYAITDITGRLHAIYEIISQSSFTVPAGALVYIDPRNTPSAVSLHDMVSLAGTGQFTLHGTSTTRAGLGFDTITSFPKVNVNGTWIDDLTE